MRNKNKMHGKETVVYSISYNNISTHSIKNRIAEGNGTGLKHSLGENLKKIQVDFDVFIQ